MLVNFFNSEELRVNYGISFSYRHTMLYTQGFKQRVHRDLPIYPVSFPCLSDLAQLPEALPLLAKKIVMALFRLLFTVPLLIYEIAVLYRLFRKLGPDILHINNGGYPAAFSARTAAIAGKLAGIPKVLMVVNNMAVGYRHYSRWLDYPVDRLVVRSVNLFITGSAAAAARLRAVLNLPKDRVTAIHNGIALRGASASVAATRERLGLNNFDGVVFGVVALLIPRKGHRVLLEAVLSHVSGNKTNGNKLKVVIEGNGPLRRELADFINTHDLSPWVAFVGDEDNIIDFMSAIDVLILPSVQDEDLPNVVLEAMALGKPVIASRLAGIPEQVIDGVTGLLVEPRNAGQLRDAIYHLMVSPEVRHEMGRAALDRFNSHFTSRKALGNYINIYRTSLET